MYAPWPLPHPDSISLDTYTHSHMYIPWPLPHPDRVSCALSLQTSSSSSSLALYSCPGRSPWWTWWGSACSWWQTWSCFSPGYGADASVSGTCAGEGASTARAWEDAWLSPPSETLVYAEQYLHMYIIHTPSFQFDAWCARKTLQALHGKMYYVCTVDSL